MEMNSVYISEFWRGNRRAKNGDPVKSGQKFSVYISEISDPKNSKRRVEKNEQKFSEIYTERLDEKTVSGKVGPKSPIK